MKIRSTKKDLIRSLVSLTLCGTMFIGGTLAWLSATLKSTGNIITIGKLEQEGPGEDDDDNIAKLEAKFEYKDGDVWKDASNTTLFKYESNEPIQPGTLIYKNIKITNKGNRDVHYSLSFGDAQNYVENELYLGDIIDVYIIPENVELTKDNLANYNDNKIGTLTDYIGGTSNILEGNDMLEPEKYKEVTIALYVRNDETVTEQYSELSTGEFNVILTITDEVKNSIIQDTTDLLVQDTTNVLVKITEDDKIQYEPLNTKGVNKVLEALKKEDPEATIIDTTEDDSYMYHTIRYTPQVKTYSLTDNYVYIVIKVPKTVNGGKIEGIKVTPPGKEIASGLYYEESKNIYSVTSAEGLKALNDKMTSKDDKIRNKTSQAIINIESDIDFSGYTWKESDIHVDTGNIIKEINGKGHTISNMNIEGRAMFSRIALQNDLTIKNIKFDKVNVSSNQINVALISVQNYSDTLLDNVDVSNSSFQGPYKVSTLVGSVYDEKSSTTTTTIIKNCDITDCTVTATQYDYFTTGLVAFVYKEDNDKIELSNNTITNVKLFAPNHNGYNYHAFVYAEDSEILHNEAKGVIVTNCTFENK